MTRGELREWRARWGMTQSSLARALSITPASVNQWERGKRPVPAFLYLALTVIEARITEKRRQRQDMIPGTTLTARDANDYKVGSSPSLNLNSSNYSQLLHIR
jgi:DNA-binding XRE family transcriptional regulator